LSLIYIIAEACSAIIDLYMIKNEKADFTDEIIIRSVDLYDDIFHQCWSRRMYTDQFLSGHLCSPPFLMGSVLLIFLVFCVVFIFLSSSGVSYA